MTDPPSGIRGSGGAGQGDQAVGADVQGLLEDVARRGCEDAFVLLQVSAVGEGEAVDEEVDRAELLPGAGEELLDRFVVRDVAGVKPGVGEAVLLHRLADAALGFLGIVHRQEAEAAVRALLDGVARDVRRDAAVVGDVEDQSFFPVEQAHEFSW